MIVMTAQTSLLLCLPSQWRNGLSRVLRPIATCQSLLVSFWTKHERFDRGDQERFSAFKRLKGLWSTF